MKDYLQRCVQGLGKAIQVVRCPGPGGRTATSVPRKREKDLVSEPEREQDRELPLASQPRAVAFQGAMQLTSSEPANRATRQTGYPRLTLSPPDPSPAEPNPKPEGEGARQDSLNSRTESRVQRTGQGRLPCTENAPTWLTPLLPSPLQLAILATDCLVSTYPCLSLENSPGFAEKSSLPTSLVFISSACFL